MNDLKVIHQSEWYKQLPSIIQQVVDQIPPNRLYKIKHSGLQCFIISYEEPESGKIEDVTITVQKTGKGSDRILGNLHTNKVFGYKIDDLESWK